MKKSLIASVVALSLCSGAVVRADEPVSALPNAQDYHQKIYTWGDPKVDGVRGAGMGGVLGAIVGGPVGAAVGIAGGALIGDHQRLSQQEQELVAENQALLAALAKAEQTQQELQRQLQEARSRVGQCQPGSELARAAAFELHYRTAGTEPEAREAGQLEYLSELMRRHRELSLRIVGHTDVRGSNEANQGLASARANSVAQRLQAAGIDATRLQVESAGESEAAYASDDFEGRAFDRRVELIPAWKGE